MGEAKYSKKKKRQPLGLKSDSFVVESNVHFPTDYNLLYDCARVCIHQIIKLNKKYESIAGWRKAKNWSRRIKNLARILGKVSKGGICAYNLKKTGRELLSDERKKLKAEAKKRKQRLAKAA